MKPNQTKLQTYCNSHSSFSFNTFLARALQVLKRPLPVSVSVSVSATLILNI